MAINSALYDQIVSAMVMKTLANKLAPLRALSTDFTEEFASKKGLTMDVGLASGNTVVQDPTNYEAGDSNIAPLQVVLNEQSVSWNVTNADYNASSAARIENGLQANLDNLADAIWDVVATLISEANFGASIIDAAQTLFSVDDAKTAWASIPKVGDKHLILDSVAYSELMPSDRNGFDLSSMGAYGFAGIHNATKWDAASNSAYGFAGGRDAIIAGSKLPELQEEVREQLSSYEVITIPGINLSVLYARWAALGSRKAWASVGVYFGAAVGQAAAGKLIASV